MVSTQEANPALAVPAEIHKTSRVTSLVGSDDQPLALVPAEAFETATSAVDAGSSQSLTAVPSRSVPCQVEAVYDFVWTASPFNNAPVIHERGENKVKNSIKANVVSSRTLL